MLNKTLFNILQVYNTRDNVIAYGVGEGKFSKRVMNVARAREWFVVASEN